MAYTLTESLPLKCSQVSGPRSASGFEAPWDASEVVSDQGGKFVIKDATSGELQIAGDGEKPVVGWADDSAGTKSAGDMVHVIDDPSAIFIIPIAYDGSTYTANYSEALRGEACDLIVISDVQKANLTTSDDDQIIIVDGKACTSTTSNDGYILCKLNTARTPDGVA